MIRDCPRLASTLVAIYDCIAAASCQLRVSEASKIGGAPKDVASTISRDEIQTRLRAALDSTTTPQEEVRAKTILYPFFQMKPYGLTQEETVMERLLDQVVRLFSFLIGLMFRL